MGPAITEPPEDAPKTATEHPSLDGPEEAFLCDTISRKSISSPAAEFGETIAETLGTATETVGDIVETLQKDDVDAHASAKLEGVAGDLDTVAETLHWVEEECHEQDELEDAPTSAIRNAKESICEARLHVKRQADLAAVEERDEPDSVSAAVLHLNRARRRLKEGRANTPRMTNYTVFEFEDKQDNVVFLKPERHSY